LKQIETLTEDIYNVVRNGADVSEQEVNSFGQKLGSFLVSRLMEKRGKGTLRLSNLGTPCNRKLWYTINWKGEREELPAEAKLKYLIGDLWEQVLIFLSKLAGHKVEREQEEVELNGVLGHIDGVVDGVVVDAKSASSISFDKFKDHLNSDVDDFGYITQLDTYREATPNVDKTRAAFLVADKVRGKLTLDIHPKGVVDWSKVVDDKRKMLTKNTPPRRPYMPVADGKSGNMKIPTVCSYCEFKKECWKGSNDGTGLRVFYYGSGPRFLTWVARLPEVREGSM
jgi:hypothetical protein